MKCLILLNASQLGWLASMRFDIKDSIDNSEIVTSASQLTEEMIVQLSDRVKPHLMKIKPREFLFLMANLGFLGTNLDKNIELIRAYFSNLKHLGLKLEIEAQLSHLFLKKYETEEAYNAFYSALSSQYKETNSNAKRNNLESGITFFCHSPVLLAHTNPMFKMLGEREKPSIPITVASLYESGDFSEACDKAGVRFLHLKGKTYAEAYKQLLDIANNQFALVWQCAPLHLPYVSSLCDNLIWWSHKFHPNIPNPKLRVGSSPNGTKSFEFNDQEWMHFDVGFSLESKALSSRTSKVVKKHFGSFCREELIDKKRHWLNVKCVLGTDTDLIYRYAGRKPVHKKWCEVLKIDEKRIEFLGWLKKPATQIQEMTFLLDGPVLGHGLMAFEAINSGIPMLMPFGTSGAYANFIARNKGRIETPTFKTIFNNDLELSSIVKNLMDTREKNIIADNLFATLQREFSQQSNFDTFLKLAEGHLQ